MCNMTEFIPGLKLSRLFYQEAVHPILEKHFSGLLYSAALIGHGSEVLGYDTPRSTDHHWGPQLQIFLSEKDYPKYELDIKNVLSSELPHKFRGYSTSFGDADNAGVRLLVDKERGPVNHRVVIITAKSFFRHFLNFDPYDDIGIDDWLTFPEQELLSLTRGEIFCDGLGELNELRDKFKYYPQDVWLFLIACQWKKISQQEAFIGRCGELGDELGKKIIAGNLVKELMQLCFLFEKTYFPYSKWFGTAFSQLKCSNELIPIFNSILNSSNWHECESNLLRAYIIIGNMHNSLGITKPVEASVSEYFGRPYLVIHADRFSAAAMEAIKDNKLKAVKPLIGSVDQFIDNADFLNNPRLCSKAKNFFE
jgi:Domain of unknown function (DUF4037)